MWPQPIFINLLTGGISYITGVCTSLPSNTLLQVTFPAGTFEDGDCIVAMASVGGTRVPNPGWKFATQPYPFITNVANNMLAIDSSQNASIWYKFWQTGDSLTIEPFQTVTGGGGGVCMYVLRGVDRERPIQDSFTFEAEISSNAKLFHSASGYLRGQRRVADYDGAIMFALQAIQNTNDLPENEPVPPTIDGTRVLAAGTLPDGAPTSTTKYTYLVTRIGAWSAGNEIFNWTDGDPANNTDLVVENWTHVRTTTPSNGTYFSEYAHWFSGAFAPAGRYWSYVPVTLEAGKHYSLCIRGCCTSPNWGIGFEGPSGQLVYMARGSSTAIVKRPTTYHEVSDVASTVTNSNGSYTYDQIVNVSPDETGTWKAFLAYCDASGEFQMTPGTSYRWYIKSMHLSEVPGPDYAYGANSRALGANGKWNDYISVVPVFSRPDVTNTPASWIGASQTVVFRRAGNYCRSPVRPDHATTAWASVDDAGNLGAEYPTRVLNKGEYPNDVSGLAWPGIYAKAHIGNDGYGLVVSTLNLNGPQHNSHGNRRFYVEIDLLGARSSVGGGYRDTYNARKWGIHILSVMSHWGNPAYHYNSYQGSRPAYEYPSTFSASGGGYDFGFIRSNGFVYGSNGVANSSFLNNEHAWTVGDTIGLLLDCSASPATVTWYKNGSEIGSREVGGPDVAGNRLFSFNYVFGTHSQDWVWSIPRINETGPFKFKPVSCVAWDYCNTPAEADFGSPTVQTYTSPATWSKPVGVRVVEVVAIGGGGGGGGGTNYTGSAGGAGTGGHGGGYAFAQYRGDLIPASITISAVGQGGAGGTGRTNSGVGATAGGNGGDTVATDSNGKVLTASGGTGGLAAAAGFSQQTIDFSDAPTGGGHGGGHSSGSSGGVSYGPFDGWKGGGGGGCGGFVYQSIPRNSSYGGRNGATGQPLAPAVTPTIIDDPTPPGGTYGTNGTDGYTDTTTYGGGGGGAGGGALQLNSPPANGVVKAGNGGNGGWPGGGGGGGGSVALTSGTCDGGDGGDGQGGVVYIFEYY